MIGTMMTWWRGSAKYKSRSKENEPVGGKPRFFWRTDSFMSVNKAGRCSFLWKYPFSEISVRWNFDQQTDWGLIIQRLVFETFLDLVFEKFFNTKLHTVIVLYFHVTKVARRLCLLGQEWPLKKALQMRLTQHSAYEPKANTFDFMQKNSSLRSRKERQLAQPILAGVINNQPFLQWDSAEWVDSGSSYCCIKYSLMHNKSRHSS
jgi:hypothetical protein